MFIKELRIRNFRSFVKVDIPLNDMSILVGFNDVGKSNVLKALNLFFNNETDYEKPIDFDEDYCKYTPIRKKKADEIFIELLVDAPKSYKGSRDIKWTKIWRKSGLFSDEKSFSDGKKFPPKSKLHSWLKNIRYTYVPAIRGTSYFQILLAKLHDTLAETIEDELKSAGDDFIDKIKLNTEEMAKEIFKRMEITSQIRFPSNLRALFKTLDFATDEGNFAISLSNRGDGIKTRHIPAILKFISDQLNVNKIKGAPNVIMLWGYEEPENNLEMSATFMLAEQFIDYSSDIQLLITTHSPGFYSLKSKYPDIIYLYKVIKPNNSGGQISPLTTPSPLDDDMGIMPLIAPYIEEKVNEIKGLTKDIEKYKKELEKITSNVIFVEGEDEVRIFSRIIEELELSKIIVVKNDGLGCSGVKNQIMAWSWISGISPFKAVGIFDYDPAGKKAYSQLKQETQFSLSSSSKKVKALTYKVPTHLQKIIKLIHNFPIELEEMYSVSVWKIAKDKDWLVARDIDELYTFVRLDSPDQTISEKLNSLSFSEDELLYILFKIPDKHKDKISKYLVQDSDKTSYEEKLGPLLGFFKSEIVPFIIL